jgi:hypothetical protein
MRSLEQAAVAGDRVFLYRFFLAGLTRVSHLRALNMKSNKLHKIGATRFTDGIERDVFEDAKGRQFVEDDGELVAGQWLLPADEPDTADRR